MEYRLKSKYLKTIKDDAILYGKVAHALGIGAPSLVTPLKNNSIKFTQKNVLKVISEYLNVHENELIEEYHETETAWSMLTPAEKEELLGIEAMAKMLLDKAKAFRQKAAPAEEEIKNRKPTKKELFQKQLEHQHQKMLEKRMKKHLSYSK